MIVITAPTSKIGKQLLDNLLISDAPLRVVARDPARLDPRVRERVEVVPGSHGDPEVVEKAFAGADTVFWLVPPNPGAPSIEAVYLDFSRPACEAFVSQSVRRVVGVSALGRFSAVVDRAGHVTASLAMDDQIAATGVAYRALTMPSFMDNMLRQAVVIRDQGVFLGPGRADRRMPTCAVRDVAAVAARLLLDPSWTGAAEVPVLGPEDLSNQDMAQIMTQVLGMPVRYQQVPADAFKASMLERGVSESIAQAMLDMMAAKDDGLDNAVPRTPETSTPTSFREWCEDVLKPAVES